MREIKFVIGYPKTGTTFLETYLRKRKEYKIISAEDILSATNDEGSLKKITREFLIKLTWQPVAFYNKDKQLTRFNSIVSDAGQNIIIFFEFILSNFHHTIDPGVIVERISELSEANKGVSISIIVMTRDEKELIKSMYRDHPSDPANYIKYKPVTYQTFLKKSEDFHANSFQIKNRPDYVTKLQRVTSLKIAKFEITDCEAVCKIFNCDIDDYDKELKSPVRASPKGWKLKLRLLKYLYHCVKATKYPTFEYPTKEELQHE